MAKNDSFIEIGFDFRLIHLVGVKEEKNEYLEHMFLSISEKTLIMNQEKN